MVLGMRCFEQVRDCLECQRVLMLIAHGREEDEVDSVAIMADIMYFLSRYLRMARVIVVWEREVVLCEGCLRVGSGAR